MGRYAISVKEILKRTVIVEADNITEAVEIVKNAVWSDKILLDEDDYDDREIEPSEYWPDGVVSESEDVSDYFHLENEE